MRAGEVSLLAGLVNQQDTKSTTGIPGLSGIPILRRLFTGESLDRNRSELMIAIIPHVVRGPVHYTRQSARYRYGHRRHSEVEPGAQNARALSYSNESARSGRSSLLGSRSSRWRNMPTSLRGHGSSAPVARLGVVDSWVSLLSFSPWNPPSGCQDHLAADRRKIGKGIRGAPLRFISTSKQVAYATHGNEHSAKPERS